ncbi:MAG: tRNA (guanosine(37)-N1)-methyltransferase TrmD [Bacteroidota bacterium]
MMKRAREKGMVVINIHDIRDYSRNKHKKVDDYPFGGGGGMVMCIEPIHRVIDKLKKERDYDEIIYTSPDGEQFRQPEANRLSTLKNIIILCGHYKGIDHRVRDHLVTKEISIGDFVLTGGEMAAAMIIDATVRLIPGVISDETSALSDSYQDNLLAPPVYTRPADYHGWKVPNILLSGNQKAIDEWKIEKALERTKKLRPDLLEGE